MRYIILLIILILTTINSYAEIENSYKKHYKMRIMIDLDGVLNDYEKYDTNKIPALRKGADVFIRKLYETNDYELYLFTARNTLDATKWLIDNNIDQYFTNVTNVKIPANIYIDDRGITFNGNYDNIYKEIRSFKPYWK